MSKAERERRLIRGKVRQGTAALSRRGALNPRSTAPRYPNGRIKPPTPNEVVVEHRRRLLGNPKARGVALRYAENPLDLMLDRGWLTRPLHENAGAFRRLYLAAFPALPDLKTTRVDEEPGPERFLDRLAHAPASPNPDGNPAAMMALRALWRVLKARPRARRALIEVCLLPGHWPSWLIAMTDRRALKRPEAVARAALFEGLHIIGQVLSLPPSALAA